MNFDKNKKLSLPILQKKSNPKRNVGFLNGLGKRIYLFSYCKYLNLDAAYQESPTTCIWLIDTPQACVITFSSNPSSEIVAFHKTGWRCLF